MANILRCVNDTDGAQQKNRHSTDLRRHQLKSNKTKSISKIHHYIVHVECNTLYCL